MSKTSSRVMQDSKKLTNSKSKELSDRTVQKSKKPTENGNVPKTKVNEPIKTSNSKSRELSTDRAVQKLKKPTENGNVLKTKVKEQIKTSNSKLSELSTDRAVQKPKKPTENGNVLKTKVKEPTKTSKISTVSKTTVKSNSPSTSKTNLATNKKAPPAPSKMSSVNKLPSSNRLSNDKPKKPASITPPSNRVTKTQYFPTKNNTSNGIKNKPTEIKTNSPKPKQEQERPRTATLRKGSIVNSNVVGPDLPRSETSSSVSIEMGDDYEDDFDSYESDFEEYKSSSCTSSINSELQGESSTSSESTRTTPKQSLDEERKLDSGNYDMHENKYKLSLTNIKESSEKENKSGLVAKTNCNNMASLSDEGFEDGKTSVQASVICLNFAKAQQRLIQNTKWDKQKKRGEEILSMIKLDHCNFTLFEMASASYDVFIQSFGNRNSMQISTQTGEDDISEEVQTEPVESTTKWTQFPVTFSKVDCSNANYLEIYKEEYAGVGGDDLQERSKKEIVDDINDKKYRNGLLNACEIVLNLLYESQSNYGEKFERNSKEIPFSVGYINLNTQFSFLKDKPISLVAYCSINKILTVHDRKKDKVESDEPICGNNSIMCLWNILNSKEPEKVFNVPGILSCCCCFENNNLIAGGLHDGSLALWNLGILTKSLNTPTLDQEITLRQPIFTTEICTAHLAKVVGIKPLLVKDETALFANNASNQLCSLDESGVLIIWIIMHKPPIHNDQNILYWNRLTLVQNLKMCLTNTYPEFSTLFCTDLLVNFSETYHIFVSTNYGNILHCLSSSSKARPKKYFSNATKSQVNCLVSCPFSSQYFLAGHDDGYISLYNIKLEKSLMAFSNRNNNICPGVQFIQWSYKFPCCFYIKDYSNTIHIWDIKKTDLFPTDSVPFEENITALKLTIPRTKSNEISYMILATDSGAVHLHILDSQSEQFNLSEYETDVEMFQRYVNRL